MALRIFIKLGWLYIRSISSWVLGFVLICLSLKLAWADHKTEEVIKDIRDKSSAITSYRADVVAKIEMMGETIAYEGKWFYKKPNMSRVEIKMDKPAPMIYIVVLDGNFIYSYVPEEKVVQKISMEGIDVLSAMIGLIPFDPSDFLEIIIINPQYAGKEELDGKEMYILENKSRDVSTETGMPYEEDKLWIGAEDGFLRKIVASSGKGNKSFEFKNVELNPTFTEDTFRLIPPEGVYIHDGTEVAKNPFSNEKAMELFTYANINAENRNYDKALQIIQTIDEPFLKVLALINLSNKYREKDKVLEMLSQSFQVTQTIKDVFYKTKALAKISTGYAEVGQYEQAIQIAEMIEKTYNKVLTLTNIASKYVKDGQKDKALEILSQAFHIAQTIEKTDEKAGALIDIAGKYIEDEQKDKALEVLSQAFQEIKPLKTAFVYNIALLEISGKYAEIGQYDQAIQVAQTIMEGSSFKVDALTNIADKYAKAGQNDKIPEVLFQALQTVQTIKDIYLKSVLLKGIINRYEASGVKVDERTNNLIDEIKKELKYIK